MHEKLLPTYLNGTPADSVAVLDDPDVALDAGNSLADSEIAPGSEPSQELESPQELRCPLGSERSDSAGRALPTTNVSSNPTTKITELAMPIDLLRDTLT
jgi:hypothetical protein